VLCRMGENSGPAKALQLRQSHRTEAILGQHYGGTPFPTHGYPREKWRVSLRRFFSRAAGRQAYHSLETRPPYASRSSSLPFEPTRASVVAVAQKLCNQAPLI
jgi:hypothetical protein